MVQDKVLQKAKNNAYILLRSRPRSVREVIERLKLKGYIEEVIGEVVASLMKTGDLDDERFARFWVESRMHTNPVGDVILRHELSSKGIAEPTIDMVLSEKASAYDEHELAFSIARERYDRLKKLDKRKAAKRLYDFLARRGFKFDVIKRIIGELGQ